MKFKKHRHSKGGQCIWESENAWYRMELKEGGIILSRREASSQWWNVFLTQIVVEPSLAGFVIQGLMTELADLSDVPGNDLVVERVRELLMAICSKPPEEKKSVVPGWIYDDAGAALYAEAGELTGFRYVYKISIREVQRMKERHADQD